MICLVEYLRCWWIGRWLSVSMTKWQSCQQWSSDHNTAVREQLIRRDLSALGLTAAAGILQEVTAEQSVVNTMNLDSGLTTFSGSIQCTTYLNTAGKPMWCKKFNFRILPSLVALFMEEPASYPSQSVLNCILHTKGNIHKARLNSAESDSCYLSRHAIHSYVLSLKLRF